MRSPMGFRVKSVLPSRLRSREMTAFAAARICPVERKFSSSRICRASWEVS